MNWHEIFIKETGENMYDSSGKTFNKYIKWLEDKIDKLASNNTGNSAAVAFDVQCWFCNRPMVRDKEAESRPDKRGGYQVYKCNTCIDVTKLRAQPPCSKESGNTLHGGQKVGPN